MTPDVNVLVAASRTDHPHHAVAREVGGQLLLAEMVRGDAGDLLDDEAARMHAARLGIRLVASVVADERVRHTDDLTRVAWVGQDLLIAGHRGVKDHLAKCLAVSPN